MTDNSFDSAVGPGARLAQARVARSLTAEQAAAALRVPPSVIVAMESNRFEAFDAPVYARGFLRQYAGYLALDVATVLAEFEACAGVPAHPTHVPVTPAAPRRRRPVMQVRLPSLKSVLLTVVVVALLAGAYWYSGRAHRLIPAAPLPTPIAPTVAPAPIVAPSATAATPAALPESIPMGTGDVASDVPAAMRAVPPPAAVADTITIRGLASGWVGIVDTSGARLFGDQVRAGEWHTVHGRGPYQVTIDNVDAIELSLGAHIVDVPAAKRHGTAAQFALGADGSVR